MPGLACAQLLNGDGSTKCKLIYSNRAVKRENHIKCMLKSIINCTGFALRERPPSEAPDPLQLTL